MAKTKGSSERRELPFLRDARERYAERWSNDASSYGAQGAYRWMTSHLDGLERIVEIGCGDGTSTLELVQRGHKIIAVDENPACVIRAAATLRANGITCEVLLRGTQVGTQSDYEMRYPPLDLLASADVVLVESDIVVDPHLEAWLQQMGPIDGIMCALIGTYAGRDGQRTYKHAGVDSGGKYRAIVQNRAFELADAVLRPSGRLLLVDRGERPTPLTLSDRASTCRRQAAALARSLRVSDDVASYPYSPTTGGVPVHETRGSLGLTPDFSQHALIAVHLDKTPFE